MRKQKERKLELNSYKGKYVTLKDIHANIKDKIKVQGAWVKKKNDYRDRELTYKEYYGIISKYFEKVINEVAVEREEYRLPNKMGRIYIKKLEHKRPFHLRIDREASKEAGEYVWYKVPILDDYYNKLVWNRHQRYKRYKILPLNKFKKLIKKVKEY